MLKNYVVKVANVEVGEQNKIIKYLVNREHKNHKNTVINSTDNALDYQTNLLNKIHTNEVNYLKNKKGGRKLKRIAKSFTFNLPKNYDCSLNEIKLIDELIKSKLAKSISDIGIELNIMDIFSASHYQENKHIHLILPTVDNNGKNVRYFNTPTFLTEIKVIFTEIVDKVLEKNIENVSVCSTEQTEHNQEIIKLRHLIRDYQAYIHNETMSDKALKFMKNAIIKIERIIENADDEISPEQIEKVNKDLLKINKSEEIKSKFTLR